MRYAINSNQYVEVMPLPATAGVDRLDHIAFRTPNVEALRRYLQEHNVPTPNQISVSQGPEKVKWLEVKDFEGNHVQFVEESKTSVLPPMAPDTKLVGHHIIHIGMAIRIAPRPISFTTTFSVSSCTGTGAWIRPRQIGWRCRCPTARIGSSTC